MDASAVKSLYTKSSEAAQGATALSIRVDSSKSMNSGVQTFTEIEQQTLQYNGYGTESFCASMDGTITIGKQVINQSEQYQNNTAYITVNGSGFSGAMTPEAYTERFVPAIPIQPSLYKDAKAELIDGKTVLSFTEPTQAENWVLPDNAEFTGASASAVLTSDGALISTTYLLNYTIGNLSVSQITTVTILSTTEATVATPNAATTYTALEQPDTPILLEKASAYLLQANNVQSTTISNIVCEAFAINRDQTTVLSLSGIDDNFRAQLIIDVYQVNQGKGGEVTQIHQDELFENDGYSISKNGGDAVSDPAVNKDIMLEYCQNILVETILLPEHITGASVDESNSTCRLVLSASKEMTEALFADICNTLYGDPDLLDTLASSCIPEVAECYLEIDKVTGLPVGSGLLHRTVHSIQDISYLITYQTNQIYTFA